MCGGRSAEVACGVVGVVVCGGEAVAEVGCAEGDDEVASAVEDATLFRERKVGAAAAWPEGWSADC